MKDRVKQCETNTGRFCCVHWEEFTWVNVAAALVRRSRSLFAASWIHFPLIRAMYVWCSLVFLLVAVADVDCFILILEHEEHRMFQNSDGTCLIGELQVLLGMAVVMSFCVNIQGRWEIVIDLRQNGTLINERFIAFKGQYRVVLQGCVKRNVHMIVDVQTKKWIRGRQAVGIMFLGGSPQVLDRLRTAMTYLVHIFGAPPKEIWRAVPDKTYM